MPLITTEYDPNVCQCCGADATANLQCVCTAYPEWIVTENGETACGYHKAELFIKTERKTVALGAPGLPLTHDPYRNYRNG